MLTVLAKSEYVLGLRWLCNRSVIENDRTHIASESADI